MLPPKPLPEVPSSSVLRRLTISSNAHIRTFIQRIIDEQGLDSSWTFIVHAALVEFGEQIELGQWLPGMKQARKAHGDASILAQRSARERVRHDRERLKELKAGKTKGKDKEDGKQRADDHELPPLRTDEERCRLSLKEIHAAVSAPATPAPSLLPKHLLLTVAPHLAALPEHDFDFDIVPQSKGCSFQAGTYSLPFLDGHGEGGVVICGLDSWTPNSDLPVPRIVGGTFTFRNVASAAVYRSLTDALRLSIYTYLSLVLEQHVLLNSHISLEFPPPPPPPTPPPTPSIVSTENSPVKRRTRAAGIWSFLSKKTEGVIHRMVGDADEALPRTSSLDLSSVFSSKASWRTRRTSEDSARPVLAVPESESATNTVKASHARVVEEEERRDRDRFGPFTSAVRRIQDRHCVLSTSPGVVFPLPPLIARLAEQEQQHAASVSSSSSSSSSSMLSVATAVPATSSGPPNVRLTGVDKAGLSSVLGWEGREARGRGMVGARSFVRHQGLTVLYTEHIVHLTCGRPRWMTFRYWARDADWMLGETVERACGEAEEQCEREGCDEPRGKHTVSWTCAGVKIAGAVARLADMHNTARIVMWETCAVCGKGTEWTDMDDGTYLFSFAKFLELLIWSPILASLSLCEHTTPPPADGISPPSDSRFQILRHFAHNGHILTLTLTAIHNNVYDIRVPKLQVIAGSVPKDERLLSEVRRHQAGEEERRALNSEIDEWWKGFKYHLDGLEAFLEREAAQALEGKDLPPLPITDDQDLDDDRRLSPLPDRLQTPSPARLQISYSISLPLVPTVQTPERPSTPRWRSSKPAAPYPPGLPISIRQSRERLVHLRMSFLKTENTLRQQVDDTPIASLNDVRRAFRSTARGVSKRLTAWQKKHVPGAPSDIHPGNIEPEWWKGTCHAVPGGRVVVREGEWGSVIAFTLSSLDYQRELANLNSSATPPSSAPSSTSLAELPSPTPSARALKSSMLNLDPDETDPTFWEEAEPWTAVITRREHPREASALLSLRDVLRTKRSFDSSSLGSRFTGSVSRGIANFTPPSAWAPPQVQVNLLAADGQVSQFSDAGEVVERVLEAQLPAHHQHETTLSSDDYLSTAGVATPTASGFIERHIRSGKSSILTFDTVDEKGQNTPAMPPKTESTSHSTNLSHGHFTEPSSATTNSSFSGALSSAMRYFLNTGTGSPPRSPSPAAAPHHGLLALETTPIDERPHIKYDWTIGKRLKFSCTVYYAKQFDALRKRCGVDDVVMKSLERSENWTAVGGKSKSNFWKSSDDRFIIKTLVNAWNVADLQVLIDLAPSYFRYVDSTASKASVLAKLMGFYTIEIKNLESGTVQAKHDLLVMENLFYKQKIAKTFDLKGIQSRRVKPNGDGSEQRTLFDGEWIEAQQRMPLLIQPYSKYILEEAIKADADFLAKSNIMDYSLLLGIDEEHREIVCGLVDTIGSYTFAKTLEYKAKQNLNSGKGREVTVIPPIEYHNRFVGAMDSYFLGCPDKWTKPQHYVDFTAPEDLASVV